MRSPIALHRIGEGIWEYAHDVRFCGVLLPHRMTIIQLSAGRLLLHSPTRCDEETVGALAQIGTVTEIVAPNGFHDLFLAEWLSAIPGARLWIPPRMGRYFPRVPGTEVLCEDSPGAPWPDEVVCVPLKGLPRLNEFALYHNVSQSLVVADLLFNIRAHASLATRLAARLGGFYGRLAVPRDIRLWYVRDRVALQQSIRRLMALPFENVVIGHGANVFGSGRAEFEQAFRWLFAEVPARTPATEAKRDWRNADSRSEIDE